MVGSGVTGWGNIGAMVVRGLNNTTVAPNAFNYRSLFTHEQEVATPGYYAVHLDTPGALAELTVAGTHSGVQRYTCASGAVGCVLLIDVCSYATEVRAFGVHVWRFADGFSLHVCACVDVCGGRRTRRVAMRASRYTGVRRVVWRHVASSARVRVDTREDSAMTQVSGSVMNTNGFASDIEVHFYAIVTSSAAGAGPANMSDSGLWANGALLVPGVSSATSSSGSLGAHTDGGVGAGGGGGAAVELLVRIGLSFVDVANARANLHAEQNAGGGDAWLSFDDARARTAASWEAQLARVSVTPPPYAAEDELRQFYAGVYRTLLAPTNYTESNGLVRGRGLRVWHATRLSRRAGLRSVHGVRWRRTQLDGDVP